MIEYLEANGLRATDLLQDAVHLNARGKALSTATYFEVDEVIDPADSRRWVATALLNAPPRPRNPHKKRPNIDTW